VNKIRPLKLTTRKKPDRKAPKDFSIRKKTGTAAAKIQISKTNSTSASDFFH
jgi:hypothetical protein